MNFLLALGIAVSTLFTGFTGGALYQKFFASSGAPLEQNLGAVNFVGTLPTTLSGAGITSLQTSIGVTSLTITQTGQKLAMADFGAIGYITLEPGVSSRQEFASFTGITQNSNGSASLTGVTRGLAPVAPYTASTSVAFSHGGGTKLIVSNSPPFYNNFALNTNDATVNALWTFGQLPVSSLLATSSSQLVTKAYVDGGLLAGAATATESVTGISRLATALQQASSTPSTSNTPLVIQAQNATSSKTRGCATGYTSTAGAGCVPVAQLDGFLKQDWNNLAQPWTFGSTTATSSLTSLGTTTLATTTVTTNLIGKNFGGNGVDGALSISSGNTDINLGGATTTVLNYTSIAITGTGALRFNNPNDQGSTVILRSQGDCTLTSSAAPMLSATSTGGNPGTTVTAEGVGGVTASTTLGTIITLSGGAGSTLSGTGVSTAGSASLSVQNLGTSSEKYAYLTPGSGGGSGATQDVSGDGVAVGGRGGRGGGVIIMECAGRWNFTTASGISVSGNAGTAGTYGGTRGEARGGGGGGGGVFFALYNLLTANSGTVTVTGGTAGGGVCTAGAGINGSNGAAGGASVRSSGSSGTGGGVNTCGTSASGADGVSSVVQNISN